MAYLDLFRKPGQSDSEQKLYFADFMIVTGIYDSYLTLLFY